MQPIVDPRAPIRVALIDDHARWREGIRDLLVGEPGVVIVAEGTDGRDALRIAREFQPDVLFLDVDMPGMGGLEAARALREDGTATRVVMLTVSEDADDVAEAMLAGACGYLVKGASARQIAFAARTAANGEVFLAPAVAGSLLARWMPGTDRARPGAEVQLSDRELTVLRLLVAGRENNEIADALCISPNTVRRHVQAILRKLGAENRTQAAVHAVREGLI
jgi:two-component system, NarL family, nitrate/nitrite response regulator NarL